MRSEDCLFVEAARHHFDFLTDDFALRRVTVKANNFTLVLTYRGPNVAVRVHFEPRDDAVWVTLHRVVGRRLPEYGDPEYRANSWDLVGILFQRAPLAAYEYAYRWGYRPYTDVMQRCADYANALKCYVTDILRGDFSDLPMLRHSSEVAAARQCLRDAFTRHAERAFGYLRRKRAHACVTSSDLALEPWVRYDAGRTSVLITYHDYVGCISVLVLVGTGTANLRAAGIEPSVERIGRWSIQSCLEAGGLPSEEPLTEGILWHVLDQLARDLAALDTDQWCRGGASAPRPGALDAPTVVSRTAWPGCSAALIAVPTGC